MVVTVFGKQVREEAAGDFVWTLAVEVVVVE
jgi:hypothetical protein